MKRKIRVYGPLAKFLGWKEIEADCNSVAEVAQFLAANWPNVEAHMAKQYYKIKVNDNYIDETEIGNTSGGDIEITPVVSGSNILKTVLGVALFVGSFFLPGGWTYAINVMRTIGVTLAVQGVNEMMAPDIPEYEDDPTSSFSFQGIQNIQRAGVPINVIFGECFVGSNVINQGVDSTGPHEDYAEDGANFVPFYANPSF